jgi:hypothetical protein
MIFLDFDTGLSALILYPKVISRCPTFDVSILSTVRMESRSRQPERKRLRRLPREGWSRAELADHSHRRAPPNPTA